MEYPKHRTWRVTVQVVTETDDGWTSSIGVPMFELDGHYLGIVNEDHAKQIARKIVDPLNAAKEVHISAVNVQE